MGAYQPPCLGVRVASQTNFPLRVTVRRLLFPDLPDTFVRRGIATLVPFLVCLTIALLVNDVGATFGFIGAVSRSSLFFTFPAALVLRSRRIQQSDRPVVGWERVGTYGILCLGVIVLVVGLTASIIEVS